MKVKNKFSKVGNAYHVYKNRKSILSMLKAIKKGEYKPELFSYLVAVLAIGYTLFPADLLPDFIPVVGWIDDGIALMLLFGQLKKELNKYNQELSKKQEWVIPVEEVKRR